MKKILNMSLSYRLSFYYFWVLFFAFLFLACGGQIQLREGEQKIVSGGKQPGWIFQMDNNFEVGTSEPCATEVEARSRALLDARKKIIDRIGVFLTKNQQERILNKTDSATDEIINTEVEQDIQTTALSQGLIAVKAKEYYIEKYAQKKMGEIEYFYIAYVIVPFSKAEHDALIQKTFDQITEWFEKKNNQIELGDESDVRYILGQIRLLSETCENTKKLVGMKPDLLAVIHGWVSDLEGKKMGYLTDISVVPLGNDQEIGADRRLIQKIGIEVRFNDHPLQGVEVVFAEGNEELITGTTDDYGKFQYAYDKPIIGELKLVAHLSIDKTDFSHPVPFVFQNPIQVIVKIPEMGINQDIPKNYVANSVINFLLENNVQVNNGFSISDDEIVQLFNGNLDIIPDSSCINEHILLIGRAYAFGAQMNALNNDIYQAKASAEIKLIDPMSRTILWNLKIEEDQGIGISPNEAGDDALKKLANQATEQMKENFMHQIRISK